MPTAKPRLMVTVDPPIAAVLGRLAIVQERSVASIVRELLETSLPVLEQVASTMEAMKRLSDDARSRMASTAIDDLKGAQEALEPHLEGIMGHFLALAAMASDEAPTGLEPATERGAQGDPARSASEDRKRQALHGSGTGQPPYSNTGVSSDQTGNIQASRGRCHG